jgi:hypothetical protein
VTICAGSEALTLRTNSDELDALVLEELQAGTGVLKHLSADLGLLVVLVDGLARNDLEQVDQQQTVGQIRGKVLDLHHALEQEVVRPASEGLRQRGETEEEHDQTILSLTRFWMSTQRVS